VKGVDDFDLHYTCAIHGYNSVEDYYYHHSCIRYLPQVSVPLLLINALDDPLVAKTAIPMTIHETNDNVIIVTTEHGGHLAWCELEGSKLGIFPSSFWHEKLTLQFVDGLFTLNKGDEG